MREPKYDVTKKVQTDKGRRRSKLEGMEVKHKRGRMKEGMSWLSSEEMVNGPQRRP